MRHQIVCVLLMTNMLVLGCATSRSRRPYPPDAMLLDKWPVEAPAQTAVPQMLPQAEPTPPTAPAIAIGSPDWSSLPTEASAALTSSLAAPEFRTAERISGPVQGQPVDDADKTPVAATPAIRAKEITSVSNTPAIRRQVPETYGNAADYVWLQGILEKHHSRVWELRYCDLAREDKHGGKVVLGDDPRLASFGAGDLIHVEGEIVPEEGNRNAWRHFPKYRVRKIWLAQEKSTK